MPRQPGVFGNVPVFSVDIRIGARRIVQRLDCRLPVASSEMVKSGYFRLNSTGQPPIRSVIDDSHSSAAGSPTA